MRESSPRWHKIASVWFDDERQKKRKEKRVLELRVEEGTAREEKRTKRFEGSKSDFHEVARFEEKQTAKRRKG